MKSFYISQHIINLSMVDTSGNSTLLEDTIQITAVDREGKIFQRVSRVEGTSQLYEVQIALDIHSDLYPMEVGQYHSLLLASSLALDGSESKGSYNIHENQSNTLLSKYSYCMYGTVFKHSIEKGLLVVHISFGGLLMTLTGQPTELVQLEPDSSVYLLLRKLY
jgi:DNA-directed RNA polymerases I, II, and III subunit RPABC3